MPVTYHSHIDEQLVALAQDGQPGAWDELVRRHYEKLLRYVTALARGPEIANEITHDVFITAGEILPRFSSDRSFIAWLYRIAQNHMRRFWRKQRLRRIVSLEWLSNQPKLPPTLIHAEDLAATVSSHELVHEALLNLTPSLRETLLLSSLVGLTATEIAEVLGISTSAAERRVSRAKALFRDHYNMLVDQTENELLGGADGDPSVRRISNKLKDRSQHQHG